MNGIIFDLDGVLVSTDNLHYEAWGVIANHLSIPFSPEVNEGLRGIPRVEGFLVLLGDRITDLSDDDVERYLEWKNQEYLNRVENITPDYVDQHIRDLLDRCVADKRPIAIGTSSKNADAVIDRLDLR